MIWLGREVQKHVAPGDHVLDLGSGVGQTVLDTCDRHPPYTRLKCGFYVGVDFYDPYIDFLRNRGYNCVKWDLKKTPLPFMSKSFHVVLMLDLLEHLTLDEADRLNMDVHRVARKKVIVATPKRFFSNLKAVGNPYPLHFIKGDNPLQKHRCLITRSWLTVRGYSVYSKINKRLNIAVKTLRDPFES